MISLGSATWGSSPPIGLSFAYEKERSGANMRYRAKVTVDTLDGDAWYGYPIYLKLYMDGSLKVTQTLKDPQPDRWANAIVYTSDWITIQNKSTGTTSVSFNVYSGMGSTRNNTYTYSMAVDPAASAISAKGVTLGNPMTISLTRYNSGFRDTITYVCGSVNGTIATKTANTSISWTPPKSLAAQSGGKSVSIELTCSTYNGNTLLGTNKTTVECTVPSGLNPTCMLAVGDQLGYTEMYGAMVQGHSRFSVSVTGTPNPDSLAAIRAYSVNINGVVYSSSLFVTDVVTWSGTKTITATVTDAFGNKGSDSLQVTVLPYSAPVASIRCNRCDEDGSENEQGAWIKATYSATIASLNGLNSARCVLKYKKSSGTSYTSVTVTASGSKIFAADTGSSYDVVYEVTDDFTTVSRSQAVGTAQTILHIRADGTGLAFGKVSERANADEFDRPVYFNDGLYDRNAKEIRNGLAYYLSGGSVDCNTTTEELVLSNTNTPTSAFWFVKTMFYAGKTATSRRSQLAIPYDGALSLYYRTYNSSWSKWVEIPAIAEAGSSGIWTYRKYTDGNVELEGVYSVSDVACTTALGNMYRTAVLQPNSFPFTVTNPKVVANYESEGYGAFLWATTATTTAKPPNYYLVRPTSATIASGKIIFRVTGKWK